MASRGGPPSLTEGRDILRLVRTPKLTIQSLTGFCVLRSKPKVTEFRTRDPLPSGDVWGWTTVEVWDVYGWRTVEVWGLSAVEG